jgi:hypothetical protein
MFALVNPEAVSTSDFRLVGRHMTGQDSGLIMNSIFFAQG